jgi:GNAT superfamily N-acetyltransferase
MDMVVVHPAYWRRGHGSALVKWSLALADMDDLKQGVIVAEMGERLYLSLDFTKLGTVQAQDEEQPPSRIEVGLLRYDPGQSGSREHVLKSDLNVSRLFKEEVWCGNWAK